jgi:hypothetical protein
LDCFALAPVLYGNIFYLTWFGRLYPLVKMAHYSYADSVKLEGQIEKWKQHCSDVIRQNANEVIIECIDIVHGVEVRKEASLILREIAYKTHHTLEGVAC